MKQSQPFNDDINLSERAPHLWLIIVLVIGLFIIWWSQFNYESSPQRAAFASTNSSALYSPSNVSKNINRSFKKDEVSVHSTISIPWNKLKRKSLVDNSYDLFKTNSWAIPVDNEEIKTLPRPPALLPSPPFTYLGHYKN